MGISAFGASGIKPGVCTSTTRPSAPYEGMMIYETDTNRVLVWDNAAWVMIADTDTPPGLQLIKAQTIGSSVSSVTVSDVFSADFDAYKITVTGGAGTGTEVLRLQLGSSTTGYYDGMLYVYTTGVTTPQSTGSRNTKAFFDNCGIAQTNGLYANIDLLNPGLAKFTVIEAVYAYFISPEALMGRNTGIHAVATAYTDFTLTVAGGTMTGGTIRVYGYRN